MHMLRPVDSPGDDLPWTGLFTGMIIGNLTELQYISIVKRLKYYYYTQRSNQNPSRRLYFAPINYLRSSWQVSDPSRVAIFRDRNYFAEHGTDGNFDSFLGTKKAWNSIPNHFVEKKNIQIFGISFRIILQKIKHLRIPFRIRTISQKRKTLETL